MWCSHRSCGPPADRASSMPCCAVTTASCSRPSSTRAATDSTASNNSAVSRPVRPASWMPPSRISSACSKSPSTRRARPTIQSAGSRMACWDSVSASSARAAASSSSLAVDPSALDASGFDHDRDGRDEERPCIYARGRPPAERGVEPEVDHHLPADDQVSELRDERRSTPVRRPACKQDQRHQRDAARQELRSGIPAMSRSGSRCVRARIASPPPAHPSAPSSASANPVAS